MAIEKVDFSKIQTQPLSKRINKFNGVAAVSNIDKVAEAIISARKKHKQIIWMMGAHSIKLGLSPILCEMIRKYYITHLAMNGAASIHDFEMAYQNATSEDVEKNLQDGSFGNWEETGKLMNQALIGEEFMGKALGRLCAKQKYCLGSILVNGLAMEMPTTVHVAIGTDIIHQSKYCNGEDLGRTSYNDFKKFVLSVTKLDRDGVVICWGSAVILPEVFLKALSIARNMGYPVKDFTAIVVDKNVQYRELNNVVQRTTNKGYYIQAQFEDFLPVLWKRLKEADNFGRTRDIKRDKNHKES